MFSSARSGADNSCFSGRKYRRHSGVKIRFDRQIVTSADGQDRIGRRSAKLLVENRHQNLAAAQRDRLFELGVFDIKGGDPGVFVEAARAQNAQVRPQSAGRLQGDASDGRADFAINPPAIMMSSTFGMSKSSLAMDGEFVAMVR